MSFRGCNHFNQSFKSITHIHSERTKAAGQRFDLQEHGASNAQPQFVVGQVATKEKKNANVNKQMHKHDNWHLICVKVSKQQKSQSKKVYLQFAQVTRCDKEK